MDDILYKYFISPIWDKTGYNTINTLVYAVIAIIALYGINKAIKGKIKIDNRFMVGVLTFVLFGSTLRVVTDSIDTGVFKPISLIHQAVLQSHIYDYGYLTVTPGIYILTAGLLLITMAILGKLKKMEYLAYVGLLLWLPHLLLLVPFMEYVSHAFIIMLLAIIPAYLSYLILKSKKLSGIVLAQATDGAATFYIIDVFSQISGKQYFEQHVFSAALGEIFGGFVGFFILKIMIGFAAAYLISKEKMDEEDKNFVILVLLIMGFAPGIRDILRMTVGG
ncbi:MAG: DUF63 family protein [Candidatus Bilamarchaeum sp.]|jgi:uncharacterized membrane protein